MSDSDFSILGGPPSERNDESSGGNRTARDDRDTDADPTPELPPGDAATALHRARLYSLLALGLERPDGNGGLEMDDTTALVNAAAALDRTVEDAATAVDDHLTDTAERKKRWASLFGVEEGHTVSPYELTYLPGPLLTTVRQLADIRGFYHAFGIDVGEKMPYRGDHVCYQLEFLAHLCLRDARLRRAGDDEGVTIVVDARRTFLEAHLGRWFWRFAGEISAHDDGFFAAVADLLAALVEDEIAILDLDPEWVPDTSEVTEWNEGIFGAAGRSCGGCGADATGLEDLEGSPGNPRNPGSQTAQDGLDDR
ncbi:dehydrogenase [Natronorubrum sp. JWXQ-INN-674]|uniref:Dehydrogenase n=1 Tax=Natronorubrum halalkaliphilum TaxID=2691917 RepID=A0A6B0VMC7_9EURY|nr:molecular chaperone TorD family protein [Natronorubrum halalkaliphilum]MXV61902.1 dehydrogenase [Natronorubrum halalkaliphilum]